MTQHERLAELTLLDRWLRGRAPELPLLLGGQLELLAPLGRGASGMVWKARRCDDGQDIAVKIPLEQEHTVAALSREPRLIRRLGHPHIVRVLRWGMVGGLFVTEMELAEGGTLASRLRRQAGAPLPLPQVRRWITQLSAALEHIHAHGILHADIKPQNMLLDAHDNLKLTDFDASHPIGAVPGSADIQYTWPYAAPEVIAGQRSIASDLYAVGVVLYELLTGRKPYHSLEEVLRGTPVLPCAYNPAIPVELEQLILRAMARNETSRYQSCAELRQELLLLQLGITRGCPS